MKRGYGLGKVLKIAVWAFALVLVQGSLMAETTVTMETITGSEFYDSNVTDISADGSIMVGTVGINTDDSWAYVYQNNQMTQLTGMVEASGVSDDGTVIVGAIVPANSERKEAAMWVDGEITPIGDGSDHSIALCVSGDGNVVVVDGNGRFVWEEGILTFLTWKVDSSNGMSFDGSMVVGQSPGSPVRQPVVWNDGTVEVLEMLPGHDGGDAVDISSDGSVIVGYSMKSDDWESVTAVRWTNGSVEALPGISNQFISSAWHVSGDGSKIMGLVDHDNHHILDLVLWTEENDFLPITLTSLLENHNVDPSLISNVPIFTITLPWTTLLSEDGTTILLSEYTGSGNNDRIYYRIRIVEDTPTWAGYSIINEAGDVDTTPWLGWINVTTAPWIFNYDLSSWMYCPEENVSDTGAWVYVTK